MKWKFYYSRLYVRGDCREPLRWVDDGSIWLMQDDPYHRASKMGWDPALVLSSLFFGCTVPSLSFTSQKLSAKICWKAPWQWDVPLDFFYCCCCFASRRISGLRYLCLGHQFPREGHIAPNFKWTLSVPKVNVSSALVWIVTESKLEGPTRVRSFCSVSTMFRALTKYIFVWRMLLCV